METGKVIKWNAKLFRVSLKEMKLSRSAVGSRSAGNCGMMGTGVGAKLEARWCCLIETGASGRVRVCTACLPC